jgi:hypothetical protein
MTVSVERSRAFDLDQRWGEGRAGGAISMGALSPSEQHCMTQIKKGRRFMT